MAREKGKRPSVAGKKAKQLAAKAGVSISSKTPPKKSPGGAAVKKRRF
jgi:hypothetical protein